MGWELQCYHRGTEGTEEGHTGECPLPVGFAEERLNRRGRGGRGGGHTGGVPRSGGDAERPGEHPAAATPFGPVTDRPGRGTLAVCPPPRPPRPPRFTAVQQIRPAGGSSPVCPSSVSPCLCSRIHPRVPVREPRGAASGGRGRAGRCSRRGSCSRRAACRRS